MYNYSKEIVEKLHLLNNAIKVEESAVTELNLIKHRVNTKALDLIKQINQEKVNLIEQIENVKKRYQHDRSACATCINENDKQTTIRTRV